MLRKIVLVVIAVGLMIGISVLTGNMQKDKTAYVDISKVYNEFELKKECEGKYTHIENARKTILDSLEITLNMLSQRIRSNHKKDKNELEAQIQEFELKRQDYLLKKKNFEEDNDRTAKKFDEEIWKQINQYVKDYGKENDYTFIFGAEGSGAVMYARETKNISEEVIKYINSKYKGGLK